MAHQKSDGRALASRLRVDTRAAFRLRIGSQALTKPDKDGFTDPTDAETYPTARADHETSWSGR